jgi:hypothetical protein
MTDLDSILTEDGSFGALNAIVGGLANLANDVQVRDAFFGGDVALGLFVARVFHF